MYPICLVGRLTIVGHVSLCQNEAEEIGEHSYITWSWRGLGAWGGGSAQPNYYSTQNGDSGFQ